MLSRVARDYELLFRGFYSELRCETAAVAFARLRNLSPWTPFSHKLLGRHFESSLFDKAFWTYAADAFG